LARQQADPPSPCINVCRLGAGQVCRGCGRHIDEIFAWPTASPARKHAIIAAAKQRLAQAKPSR
jgi:hypothetical protein